MVLRNQNGLACGPLIFNKAPSKVTSCLWAAVSFRSRSSTSLACTSPASQKNLPASPRLIATTIADIRRISFHIVPCPPLCLFLCSSPHLGQTTAPSTLSTRRRHTRPVGMNARLTCSHASRVHRTSTTAATDKIGHVVSNTDCHCDRCFQCLTAPVVSPHAGAWKPNYGSHSMLSRHPDSLRNFSNAECQPRTRGHQT